MAVAAARALVPELVVLPRDEAAERQALDGLAGWAWQFSPQLSLRPPRALLLEVGASLKLFGGFDALLERLRSGVTGLGYQAVLASAPTPLGALCLARCGRDIHVQTPDELRRVLVPLPLSLFDWDSAVLDSLQGMGVRRIGELLRLPRDGLARRFGAATPGYLDRLFGRLPDPQLPYALPQTFRRCLQLPAEVETAAALLFALQRLVQELCGWLTGQGAGVQRLAIRLHHREGQGTQLSVGSGRPGRDAGLFIELLRERLTRLVLESPVTGVELYADQLSELHGCSGDLFGDSRKAAPDLIDRLRARLGGNSVHGLDTVAEHRPERAWRYCEPGTAQQPVAALYRPLWLLPVPRRLQVRDGRPCLQGPLQLQPDRERIEAGWWDGEDIRRDYFIAVNAAGSRYWVYRELTGERRWFLHGIFE